MRLTVSDIGCQYYEVYLDGVKQTECVVADEGRGYVERIVERRPLPFRTHKTETVKGVVEIKPMVGAPIGFRGTHRI